MTDIVKIKEEVNKQLANADTLNTLVTTTFKGLTPQMVKRAALEGMMRGFKFEDFLEKNIYAIPFGKEYSLVTSIDYARKIGMRSGVVGKSAPVFEEDTVGTTGTKVIKSCTVTIQRATLLSASDQSKHIGEYTATVFFDEFNTGRNLWKTKPRNMIAKVAEMHALRMACPEEMSQLYVEEEFQKEKEGVKVFVNVKEYEEKLKAATDLEDLKRIYVSLPGTAKAELKDLVEELKEQFAGSPQVNASETEQITQEKKFLEQEGIESLPL